MHFTKFFSVVERYLEILNPTSREKLMLLADYCGIRDGSRYLGQLIVNGILGVVLLFLTNLILADDIPINLRTVLVCAIGGVVG